MDTFLLDTLPDETRGSAYAAYSAAMMITQAGGSTAVGTLVERGVPYDVVFSTLAALLAGVVVVLGTLFALGRLPGTDRDTGGGVAGGPFDDGHPSPPGGGGDDDRD
jgi:hypothetical protein